VLRATGFVNGRWQFSTPTESTPLDRSPKNLVHVITSAAATAVTNLVQSFDGGLLGKWVKYNEIFFYLYLFFMNSLTGQTRRQIFTLDGSNDADSCKGVSLTLLPILGVKFPENSNFWDVNRCSSQTGKILKVSCYRNYCIDFNQILHNDRDHQEVIVGGPNRLPTNLGWRTAGGILKKPVKSPYLCNHLTDFDKIWYSDAY